MGVTSFRFFFMVVVSLLVYWRLPARAQWVLLLVDSLVFYCLNAEPWTLVYVVAGAIAVWGATRYFRARDAALGEEPSPEERERAQGAKRIAMLAALAVVAGMLFALKYTNFGIRTVDKLTGADIEPVHWLAPLAMSFYTLQLIACLMDSYWGSFALPRNPLKALLYAIYFPQMVCGPISRHSQIGESLVGNRHHPFDYGVAVRGAKRIAWGLMKVLVISTWAKGVVATMEADLSLWGGPWVWVSALVFVIQLYTDFSGCMDIVLGVSACFGIDLPENFQAPLLSKSIQEFWRRWHITLGTWLRDYIMNPVSKSEAMYRLTKVLRGPLGRKRARHLATYLSMFVLWFAMGLWHGGGWNFILGEGVLFWVVIVAGNVLKQPLAKVRESLHIAADGAPFKTFQVLRTLFIFTLSGIFFHSSSFTEGLRRLWASAHLARATATGTQFWELCVGCAPAGTTIGLLIVLIAMALLAAVDVSIYRESDRIERFFARHGVIRWVCYFAFSFMIMLCLTTEPQEFLYAQF